MVHRLWSLVVVAWWLWLQSPSARVHASASACAECAETEAELVQLRIIQIKQEILRKLKLKEPPPASTAPASLPAPLAHLAPQPHPPHTQPPDDVSVDKVILFPLDQGTAGSTGAKTTLNFRFQLPGELEAEALSSAELWLHKEDSCFGTDDFLISELSDNGTSLYMQKITIQSGWGNADVGSAVRRWLTVQPRETFSTVYVACSTCKIGTIPPISEQADQRPFLVLSINAVEKNRRTKRGVNCEPKTRDCCRQYLNVSFAEINWDSWIVEPSYYGAYYCKGSCTSVSSLSESKNSFQMFKRDYNDRQNKTVIPSCCTPHRYGHLQIIYRLDSQLVKATLKDMTVEECKCS